MFTTGRHPDRGSSVHHHFVEPALGTEAQLYNINFQLFVFSLPRVSTDLFGFIADRRDFISGSSLPKSLAGGRPDLLPRQELRATGVIMYLERFVGIVNDPATLADGSRKIPARH